MLELALGGLGAVEPVGDAQAREQLLGHLQHGGLGHLRLALGLQPGVVLAQPLAHGGDALQRELGDRPLLLGQRREHVGAVLLARAQPLRLRALRHLGRRREVRAVAATLARSLAARRDGRRRRARAPRRRGHRGRSPRSPPVGATVGAAGRVGVVVAVAAIAVAAVAPRRSSVVAPRARAAGRPARTAPRSAAARAGRRAPPSPSAGTTDRTRMPSMSCSVSTRSWSPTVAPPGRIDPSSTPRGSRAPAARQVHEPSGPSWSARSRSAIGHGAATVQVVRIAPASRALGRPARAGTVAAMADLRARRPGARHRPDARTSIPTRSSSARCTIGAAELGVAGRRAARRRRRDPHRRAHEHPGLQRAAHHARAPDGRRRRVRDRPHRPPRGLHDRGPGDGRQRGDRAAPLGGRHRRDRRRQRRGALRRRRAAGRAGRRRAGDDQAGPGPDRRTIAHGVETYVARGRPLPRASCDGSTDARARRHRAGQRGRAGQRRAVGARRRGGRGALARGGRAAPRTASSSCGRRSATTSRR